MGGLLWLFDLQAVRQTKIKKKELRWTSTLRSMRTASTKTTTEDLTGKETYQKKSCPVRPQA